MAININVKSSGGGKYKIDLPSLAETVAAFKVRLAVVSDIPADSQRLIFRGHVLKDVQTFQEIKDKHGLETGQTMHVVRGSSPASRSSTTANASTQTAAGAGGGVPPVGTAPFPPMGAAPGGLPGMPPGMGNPEQMAAMLNSPLMDSIMNNPELARSMMMANPQLREIMERNPEVGHVFNDPATFRQMMQMARNPSLMQEMMRNSDRQMANIEMMPGGFDALRRMQEDVQAPLMDAMQNFGANDTNATNPPAAGTGAAGANPFASLFQNTPSNAPMPNPWAPTPPPAAPGAGTGTGAAPPAGGMPAMPGAGAGGMPDMTALLGGMQGMNGDQMAAMMDNPMMQRMMQLMSSDPGMLEAMINSNPQLRQMADQNPQMAQVLRNPEFMRSMLNPETMRTMMQFRNAMGGAGLGAAAAPGAPGAGGGTATAPGTTPATGSGAAGGDMASLLSMMTAMGGLGGGGGGGATGTGTAAPQAQMTNEELEAMYAPQLQQLRDMGFIDTPMCLAALRRSNGNVNVAVENLLNSFGG